MRAWLLPETLGPKSYRLEEVEDPVPGPGEVRVKLEASALNHIDLWLSRGIPAPPLPHIAGSDGAGIVDALGPGTGEGGSSRDPLGVGDEVVLNPSLSCGRCRECLRGEQPLCKDFHILGEHLTGTHAEYVVLPELNVYPKPAELSWNEASAYGLAGATAWRMLRRGRLRAGETVLIVGVGGGVSSAAVLLAKAAGARVFVTSTDETKIDRALEMGADAGFDSAGEFARQVKDATDGRGVDVVIENVGPATWENAIRSAAPGGRLVTCGGTSGISANLNIPYLFFKQIEVIGSTMSNQEEFRELTEMVGDGRVPVVVDSVFDFEDYPDALARMEKGAQLGKIVLAR